MSEDKKKKSRNRKEKPDNKIVQFPNKDFMDTMSEDMYESMLPEFMNFYFPVTLEFASVTAVEIMNYIKEVGKQMDRGAVSYELLDIIFVKLRGLCLILPSFDLFDILNEVVGISEEQAENLMYVHDIVDDALDVFEEVMVACADYMDQHDGSTTYPAAYLEEHDARYAFDEVYDISEELIMELGEVAKTLFSLEDN